MRRGGDHAPYRYGKRLLDLLLSGLLLCFLWLPMLIIGALIRLDSRGGAIFRQLRVGREGKVFVCYKFRTMYTDAPADLATSEFEDAHRYITPVGRILRRTSLDELPQLWNVWKGDMSLVGPRPLIPRETDIHEWRRRCGVYAVRPGMTGLAQVRGRDRLPDPEKARWDARYVRSMSLWGDLSILWQTALRVCSGEGIRMGAAEEKIQT